MEYGNCDLYQRWKEAVEEMGMMAVTAMGMLEDDGDSSSDEERWATP